MPVSCQHCLHPSFTRRLLRALQDGALINLIAAPGQGRQRLLDDVMRHAPPEVILLYADLRAHKSSYSGFMDTLKRQMRYANCQHSGDEPAKLDAFLNCVAEQGRPVWILLHRFDAILAHSGVDPAYDKAFFAHLNALHNHKHMALLCVTDRPANGFARLLRARRSNPERLKMEQWLVPELDRKAVRDELNRQLPELDQSLLMTLAETILRHDRPYALMREICVTFREGIDSDLPLHKRLRACKRRVDYSPAMRNLPWWRRLWQWLQRLFPRF